MLDAPHTPPPARIQVAAKEFRIVLSRTAIRTGPAIVQLVNYGEDPHDLRLQRVGGTKVWATPVVAPGETADLVFRTMAVGKYRVWCGVATHASLGMRGTLVVTRR